MPRKNATVKAVWIDNDILAEFEQKLGGQSINSWLKEQIEGFVSGKTVDKNDPERVNPKNSKKSSATPLNEDIEEMLSVSGLPVEKFLDDLTEMMNDGSFDLSGGKLSIVYPSYISEFEETCHDCGIPVEDAMKKAAKALRRGSI